MAQTTTVRATGVAIGSSGPLKVVRVEVANGAAETTTAVDFSTYGLATILTYGFMAMDTYTSTSPFFATISGTTVTVTHANDIATGMVWAIGN